MGENNEPPRWDLSPLVESEDPEIVKREIDGTLKLAESIEDEYKGRIKDLSPKEICEFYKKYDNAYSSIEPTITYTYLRQVQDVRDSSGKELLEYAMKVYYEFESKLAFTKTEVARTLADRPEIINDSEVKEYRHALEKAQKLGKHLLPEREEQLILGKDLYGVESWSILHERLRSTRQYDLVIKDEAQSLNALELMNIIQSSQEREIRKTATEALYGGISHDRLVFSTALKSIFGDHLNQVRLRNQPSVLTQSLLSNDIDQATLDTLIVSMKQNTHLIRKYLKLRAKFMGIKELTGYDISPIAPPPLLESKSNIPWSEAKKIIIDSYSGFDEEAGKFVESLFEHRRIDASIHPEKTAYGTTFSFPSLRTSWIMVNYGGTLTDLAIAAHEIGHALHAYYISTEHRWTNFDSGTCLAETGSIFGEILLLDRLIQEAEDDNDKMSVFERVLNSLYMHVFYQLNCFLFEQSVFSEMENNEAVDEEKLDLLWTAARKEVFGNSVNWVPGMEQWWMMPVHHFRPRFRFYNYPYAFAQLLVFVLYQLYKEEGQSFVPKMKRLLSAGGSESPKTLLAEIGLDITNPKFWATGFKLAGSYLDEFEQIVKRRT